ncbi:hypothetical protein C0583_01775 [Candidatus Parcubacteria bacterium]|nr:MAG: hypothetical protein C0583_01775 [Candidatus Parcubacteria bacterium]
MNNKHRWLIVFIFIISLTIAVKAEAATFDPAYIISDEEMTNADSMTLADIEAFLKLKGGYISRNYFLSSDGELMSAAQIIYNAAHNYDCEGVELSDSPNRTERVNKCRYAPVNPKLLLVLLQKEQSLIEEMSPTEKQLAWATGYAVCDNCSMSDPSIQRWKGFGRQVNSASLQFSDYMRNPQNYGFQAGKTYSITNTGRPAMIVTIQNQATAALYNYTPHVYWGNYNFFKLWTKYFTRSYPNNSLLQVKGENGVWLIKDGKRRAFMTRGALTSRYDVNKVIQVSKSDLEMYEEGSPIKFAQYSLLRSPRGTIFLLVDDTRRGFASQEAFRKLGFNPEEIIDASWEDINLYDEIESITEDSMYPTGALLQDKATGGIYFVRNGTKAPLWDRVLLETKFMMNSIFPVDSEKLDSFKTVEPAIFDDGELLSPTNSPAVYVIDNHKRRPIVSGEAFEDLGYKWENIITVPENIINLYEEGEILGLKFEESDIEIIDPMASTTIDMLIASGSENMLIASGTEYILDQDDLELDKETLEEVQQILYPYFKFTQD